MKVNFEVIRQAYQKLLAHPLFGARLSNQWLSAYMFVEAIKVSGYISDDLASVLDEQKFNLAMSQSHVWGQLMQVYDGTNVTGIWRVKYARNYYYLANKPGEQIQYPRNLGNAWVQQIRNREVNLL